MPTRYNLQVRNDSDSDQNYSFFAAYPTVSGNPGQIWSTILTTNNTPSGATTDFEVTANYYAICGTSQGSLQPGTAIRVSRSSPVDLGSDDRGGTTCPVTARRGMLDLGRESGSSGGKAGSFEFTTDNLEDTQGCEILVQDPAHANRGILTSYSAGAFVGVGIAGGDGGGQSFPTAVFTPSPNSSYQVTPSPIFYVVAGSGFRGGQLVRVEEVQNATAVDFGSRSDRTVVHSADGRLSIKS